MAMVPVNTSNLPLVLNARVAILLSKWYPDIVRSMHAKCEQLLIDCGATVESHVLPGTFEFPYAAQLLIDLDTEIEAIICLSAVVKGETYHFEMIVDACAQQLMNLSAMSNVPIINEILPVSDIEQAKARSGDDEYNKGLEAAVAAIELIDWTRKVTSFPDDTVDFH